MLALTASSGSPAVSPSRYSDAPAPSVSALSVRAGARHFAGIAAAPVPAVRLAQHRQRRPGIPGPDLLAQARARLRVLAHRSLPFPVHVTAPAAVAVAGAGTADIRAITCGLTR